MPEVFADLAQKLGLAVEHLWPQAIRHVIAEGLGGLFVGLLAGMGAIFLFRAAKRTYEDDSLNMLYGFLGGVLALIAVIFLATSVPMILAPEGYLIRQILK